MSFESDISKLEPQDSEFYVNLYRALCNNALWKIGTTQTETCSWRYSGGVAADLHNAHYGSNEDYMDYYCSGNESVVEAEVEEAFNSVGWTVIPYSLAEVISKQDEPSSWAEYYLYKQDAKMSASFKSESGYIRVYNKSNKTFISTEGKVFAVKEQISFEAAEGVGVDAMLEKLKSRPDFITFEVFDKYTVYLGQIEYDYERDGKLEFVLPKPGMLVKK